MTQQGPTRVIAGRYAVLREIGRGGMGIVWLAEDRMIGRQVAIKELHLPEGIDPAERAVLEERVLREARTAGRLNDPGVVTVYDVLQEAGNTYIVMELIQAPTLSDAVRDGGPLPQESVAHLAQQLLSALESAHTAGIVHRDVKPSNIMVLPNGRVKLTDFGIAQALDDPKLTSSGVLVGSPSYMPPERISGQDADAASDLWALAAVLFFAVEGYSPFERSSTAATMNAILHEVPYLTRCQGPLASVIMGLLNTTPAARPSAEQVRGLLAQVSVPTVATTPPAGQPTSQLHVNTAMYPRDNTRMATGPVPRRRRPLLLAGTAVLVVAAVAGAVLVTTALAGSDQVPENMDETRTFGAGGFIPEFTLESYPVGGCLLGDVTEGRRFTSGHQTECAEDHDLQVFHSRASLPIPAEYGSEPVDTRYPDQATLFRFAESVCTMVFDSEQVSGKDKHTELRYRALVPSEQEWRESRGVYCLLYDKDGDQLSESRIALTEG